MHKNKAISNLSRTLRQSGPFLAQEKIYIYIQMRRHIPSMYKRTHTYTYIPHPLPPPPPQTIPGARYYHDTLIHTKKLHKKSHQHRSIIKYFSLRGRDPSEGTVFLKIPIIQHWFGTTRSTIVSEGFKGGTRGAPIMPRDAVSRTANVGTLL